MKLKIVFSLLSFAFLAACTDIGDRDNINDYDGINYAHGDDLYYLNRSGAGFEGEIRQGKVTGTYFIYNKEWREATDLEKDTYDYEQNEPWGVGKNGEVRPGKVNQTYYYIYETANEAWRKATTVEEDTYDYKKNKDWSDGKDGDDKWGSVNTKNCYVFENKEWRIGNTTDCSLGLRGCTALRQDTVGKGSDKVYHICDAKSWRNATTYEMDTYGWAAGKDGDSKSGSVNTANCYVYENKKWRSGNAGDCSLGLRGCTALRQDTVGKGSDKVYHICDSKNWRNATTYEKDTFGWKNSTDGAIRKGNVTDTVYVFDKTAWRATSNVESTLGGCVSAIADSVGRVGSTYYICKSNKWVEALAIEYDTYRWTAGKDGEVRAGQINKTIYYIYDMSKKAWRNATTYEKDTFGWKDSTDGAIKKGNLTDTIYVFDATAWRVTDDIEKVLGGCATAIQDSVGKVDNTYYICNPRKWNVATELQYDTYRHECSEFGQIVHGNVNDEYAYFCYGKEWKRFYGNEFVTYGKLIDSRDGRIYRTVQIGTQIWMAENLNYVDSSNYPSMRYRNMCYENNPDSCEKYGRLYTWSITIDYVYWAKKGKTCSDDEKQDPCGLPEKVQGICPEGWHVPSRSEWDILYSAMENDYRAMQAKGFSNWPNATDEYGFSALPVGDMNDPGGGDIGWYARFWSATEYIQGDRNTVAYDWNLYVTEAYCSYYDIYNSKSRCYSVRCIKDEE